MNMRHEMSEQETNLLSVSLRDLSREGSPGERGRLKRGFASQMAMLRIAEGSALDHSALRRKYLKLFDSVGKVT